MQCGYWAGVVVLQERRSRVEGRIFRVGAVFLYAPARLGRHRLFFCSCTGRPRRPPQLAGPSQAYPPAAHS
jgi:hypothetical protein